MESEDHKENQINLYSPDIFDDFFQKYDSDRNGVIDKTEMLAFLKDVAAASMESAETIKD